MNRKLYLIIYIIKYIKQTTKTKTKTKTKMIQTYFSFPLLIILGIGIADIVLSQMSASCDNMDDMGLNVKNYLLGKGIVEVIYAGLLLFMGGIVVHNINRDMEYTSGIFLLCYLFYIAWFVIGAIILFRSNNK